MGAYYPQGVYLGRVLRQELSTSSKKGTPQFVVCVQILEGRDQFGYSVPVEQSYERYVYLYLTEKAMEMTLGALKALGFNKTSLKYLDPTVSGGVDFTDTEVELYCKHEDYEGDPRERWSINTPRERREAKPPEASELRKLDALFGRALKAQAANEPQPDSNENRTLQEASTNDEDIPF